MEVQQTGSRKQEIPAGYRIIRSKVIVIGPKPTEK